MIKNKDFKNDFKKKIIIILACLGLVTSNIAVAHVEAFVGGGEITMGIVSQVAGSGLGVSAAAAAPYVILAAAIIGTGVIVYENADEIVAMAQFLYNESSAVMKSLIERAYDVGESAIIMTGPIRNFVVSSAEKLVNIFNSPEPTITTSFIDASYSSVPAIYERISVEDMNPKHVEGRYNGYIAFTLGSKSYYITGLNGISALSSKATLDSSSSKVKIEIMHEHALESGLVFNEINSGVHNINIYEYDTISETYQMYSRFSDSKYPGSNNSKRLELEDGLEIQLLTNGLTRQGERKGVFNGIIIHGVENVLGVDDYLSPEELSNLVVGNGFALTNEIRTFTGDYAPGKTVEVPVVLANPGLSTKEMEDNLEAAFPTMSGSVAVDMDAPITGVGAKDLSDVMLDTGVVAVPREAIGVKTGELVQSKAEVTTAIETFMPSVFPKAKNALTGLKNVREEPPVININLNEIFTASTKEVSPDLDSPFEEGESVFFDFADLNKYKFGGRPMIEYVRMIIGFGFVSFTLRYMWKKFTVTTA